MPRATVRDHRGEPSAVRPDFGRVRPPGRRARRATENGGIRAALAAAADPTFALALDGFSVDELTLGLAGRLSASLAIEAGQGVSYDEVYTLAEEYFEPIVFSIGPVPIVLVPKLEFLCGVRGSVSSQLTSTVTLDVGASVGFGYQDGSFAPTATLDASGAFEAPQLPDGAAAEGRVWVGPRLSILLYGLVGPYGKLDAYGRATIAVDADPWWTLHGGVEATVGIAGLLDLLDWESPPLGDEVLLAAADGPAPSAAAAVATWSRTYGGVFRDEGVTLAAAADGGAFVGGSSLSAEGAWLARLDRLGHVVWERAVEELAAIGAIVETSDGGCLAGGGGYGTAAQLAHLLRFDVNGDLLWARSYAGTKETTVDDLALMADGSIVVLGPHGVLADGDFWLARLDPAGAPRWSVAYGGAQQEYPHSLAVTGDGQLVAAGSTASFGVSFTGVWVIRVDGDGALVWQRVIDGPGNEHALGVVAAADGSLGVAGDDVSNGLVLKLGADGALAWARSYDPGSINDELHAIVATPDGGFVAAGVWNFDEPDLWLLKVDGDGQLLYSAGCGGAGEDAAGGPLELTGLGHALVRTADGGLLVAGATTSFGAGDLDVWLLKTTAAGEVAFDAGSGAHRTALAGTFASAGLVATPTTVTAQPVALTVAEPTLTVRAAASAVGRQAGLP